MYSPLQWAIEENRVSRVKALLRECPQRIEEREKYGRTPLMLAVTTYYRSLECIQAILDAGAEVNARNPGGFTALHQVIWNEYFSLRSEPIVDLLLNYGADLEDDQNAWAATPLTNAVLDDCVGDARLLLTKGANPNILIPPQSSLETIRGRSLLSLACYQPDMVEVLIRGNADVNLRDAFGQTATEYNWNLDVGQFEHRKWLSLKLIREMRQFGRLLDDD